MKNEIDKHIIFGKRLASIRKKNGYTQTELAKMIGISRKLITDYERGKVRINAITFMKMTQVLNTTAEKMFDLEPIPELEEESLKIMKRVRYIKKLPNEKQKIILELLDNYLRRQGIDIPKAEMSSSEEDEEK